MAGRKAITIIIAILLATAITLAVAMGAFAFLQKTQRSAQGITETSASNFLQRAATCCKMSEFKFNSVTNQSEAIVKNCGFRDLDLSDDNLQMLIKTQNGSCIFKLNSTNCANCVGKLGVGSFAALQINASKIDCGGAQSPSTSLPSGQTAPLSPLPTPTLTLANLLGGVTGQNVDVGLADRSASFNTATTFVPERVVVCRIELKNVTVENSSVSCINYTVKNAGNVKDIYKFQLRSVGFGTGMVRSGHNCSGPLLTNLIMDINQTADIAITFGCSYLPITPQPSGVQLYVMSSNCGGTEASGRLISYICQQPV